MKRNNKNRKLNGNVKANFQLFKLNGRTFMSFIDIINDAYLSCQARILFQIISSLSVYEGYCYASNAFLSGLLGLSESRVKVYLSELEKAGLIKTEIILHPKYGRGRHITILFSNMRKRYLKKDKR